MFKHAKNRRDFLEKRNRKYHLVRSLHSRFYSTNYDIPRLANQRLRKEIFLLRTKCLTHQYLQDITLSTLLPYFSNVVEHKFTHKTMKHTLL